jgi:uncharacterized protein (DUF3820 family)
MNTMPFGKFKGWDIRTIPVDYLIWLRENARLRPELAHATTASLPGL